MFKFFSNTILSYLELDLNNFIQNTNCMIIEICYSTSIFEGELVHSVLLHYKTPIE